MTDDSVPLCHDPDHTPRWGMVIDINRCVGCQTCTIACKHWNNTLPSVQWRRVIDIEEGEFPNVQRQFLVTGCQHCAEPPCVPVCPTGATRQRADGLVTMDYDTCIGCGYCAVSCPYQARTIAHEIQGYYKDSITDQERSVFDPERIGVAQKCTFCSDRVDQGLEKGLTPGIDPDATPACSAACIAQAIKFGDYNDPNSNVSQLVRDNPSFQMHEELKTDPQIKYLYTTPAVPERDAEPSVDDEKRLTDLMNPLVGGVQPFWDWRAAMNWIFGGVGSGAVVCLWLVSLGGGLEYITHAWMNFVGGGMIATGLFFVFLKIARKFRFWKAVLRPQTSWMTRELYVVMLFGLSVVSGLIWQNTYLFCVIGVTAAAFLVCQAMILWKARGIPTWRHPNIPWLIVTSGFLEGISFLSLAFIGLDTIGSYSEVADYGKYFPKYFQVFAVGGFLAALISFALWQHYLRSAERFGIGPLARKCLKRINRVFLPIGHLLPISLFFLSACFVFYEMPMAEIVLTVAALCSISGGVYWKFLIITRASYQQGFSMPKQPHRGSGSRAAPPRLSGTHIRPENKK